MLQDTSDHSSSKRARHNSASDSRAENSLVDIDTFHTFLTVETFNCVKMLGSYLEDNFSEIFGTKYDIVSFLYSVVLTKGPDNVAAERQDLEESLIGKSLTIISVNLYNTDLFRPSSWSRKSEPD